MKLSKIFGICKTIGYSLPFLIFFLFFSGAVFLSAFFANFTSSMQNFNATLAPLEEANTEFSLSIDSFYGESIPEPDVSADASYYIASRLVCNSRDENFNCIEEEPNLCPYLSLQPQDGEEDEHGFNLNPSGELATGYLNRPDDETDTWNLSIKAPCFEGECPADYDESQSGAPLPPELKGATFKCNLFTESNDEPVLVQNYLKQNIAYADDFSNSIEVSAVFTGEAPLPVRNPVIIIPGVLGTEISKDGDKLWLDLAHNLTDIGDQFMDALQFNPNLTPVDFDLTLGDVVRKVTFGIFPFDYSNGLVEEFKNQGYVEGTDLFLFPYDWRYGADEDNVDKLKQKISDVLAQSGASKVDVIAHSTGGLLVKKYVVENTTDNHIDKAVFVGVPNTGAPKAVKVLLQGDGFDIPWLADGEMKKIAKNLPVVYDLSPSEKYFNAKGSYVQIVEQQGFIYTHNDLNFNEANSFIAVDHNLNVEALINSHHLHTADFDDYDMRTAGIDVYAVNGCKAGTLGKVREIRRHSFLFGDSTSYLSPVRVPGDGTVPLESSTNLPIDEGNKYYALKGEHAKMMSADGTRQQIVNIISGSTLDTENIITQNISECELNGRAISIYSPLSIDIVDQDGNHAGLSSDGVSIENDIPNADFEIIGEHKFVYLPTDDGQTYTITITGTGTGTFTLTDATIDGNEITGMQVFENISVTSSLLGHITISNNTTLELDTNGDGSTDETLTPTSMLNAEEAENFVPEKEVVENNPPESDSGGSSTGSSGGSVAGVSFSPPTLSEPIIPTETPLEIPIIKQANNPKVLAFKPKAENTEQIPIQEEKLPQENILTASVADTNAPINYITIIIVIGGALTILLVAKKFGKL